MIFLAYWSFKKNVLLGKSKNHMQTLQLHKKYFRVKSTQKENQDLFISQNETISILTCVHLTEHLK